MHVFEYARAHARERRARAPGGAGTRGRVASTHVYGEGGRDGDARLDDVPAVSAGSLAGHRDDQRWRYCHG